MDMALVCDRLTTLGLLASGFGCSHDSKEGLAQGTGSAGCGVWYQVDLRPRVATFRETALSTIPDSIPVSG